MNMLPHDTLIYLSRNMQNFTINKNRVFQGEIIFDFFSYSL